MTHTHHKWDCPQSNGRHKWEWDIIKLIKLLSEWDDEWKRIELYPGGDIAMPVRCIYGCGAYGIEWYEFKEVIEGE